MPATSPVPASTVATAGELLVQVPPVVVLIHDCEAPMHIGVIPVIVCVMGAVIATVLVAVLTQPPTVTEYEITAVPAVTPVTMPVDASTVAMAGAVLVHVPPVVVHVHVWDDPIHTGVVPVIVCGIGAVMVTIFEAVLVHPSMVTE